MSDILELIQKERDRIRAKRGIQNLEPERYLSILVEEVGEAAQAINDWREGEGYIKNAMDEMVQVCAVAIDMYERLERMEDGLISKQEYYQAKSNGTWDRFLKQHKVSVRRGLLGKNEEVEE